MIRRGFLILAVGVLLSSSAFAVPVDVTITGIVNANFVTEDPISNVNPGDTITVTFTVDSGNFDEGVPGDTRGYIIDPPSFNIHWSTPVDQGLLGGAPTAYFTVVDGFPVSDGFIVSTSNVSPGGVPLETTPIQFSYRTGYVGETLDSLDILDALGTYDFDGLTVFALNLWKIAPDNVGMFMDFEQMVIELGDPGGPGEVPATSTFGAITLVVVLLLVSALYMRRRATV